MIQRLGHKKLRVADKYLLLTGATGFVGRYLLRDLLLAGHRVAVGDALTVGCSNTRSLVVGGVRGRALR